MESNNQTVASNKYANVLTDGLLVDQIPSTEFTIQDNEDTNNSEPL